MTEPTELLPCPFCGGAPTTIERPDNIDGTQFFYAIACYCGRHSACAHKMAVRKTPEIAKADAIAAWNTRTTQPTQAQADAITPPPIECNTEELKRAYAFGWWSALEKQRETAQAGAVPLNHKNIEPVRWFLAYRGIYLSDETTKALIVVAHGIKGGQHGAE